MLFRKKIDRLCLYCQHAGCVDEDTMVCPYRGIVSAGSSCRRFLYDPLRRVPARRNVKSFDSFQNEDFSL